MPFCGVVIGLVLFSGIVHEVISSFANNRDATVPAPASGVFTIPALIENILTPP
jgi:hypothetical protein